MSKRDEREIGEDFDPLRDGQMERERSGKEELVIFSLHFVNLILCGFSKMEKLSSAVIPPNWF